MSKNHKRDYLTLPEDSSIYDVAYIRLLAFAAKKASRLGFTDKQDNEDEDKDTPGFSLEELRQDPLMKGIADDWVKELLPSICTVRCSINNTEVENPLPTQLTKYHRFVIKADEYMRYITLIELDHMNKLLEEAKDSGITAKRALLISLFAVTVAILLPIFMNKYTTSSVNLTQISLDQKSIEKLQKEIEEARSKVNPYGE